MTESTSDAPPPFQPVNIIELDSVKDSKIISVSVYSGRAEVTRLFKFNVKTGQNQLNISGLPRVLDEDSLRVEGRGSATIHDVTISTIVPPPALTSSDALVALCAKEKRLEKALERTKKSLASLETYLESLNVEHLKVTQLREVVKNYDETGEELDDKVTELEKELLETTAAIKEERLKISGPSGNEKLNLKASIGVFADFEGEIKIALIYAVSSATWDAGYDIRVDMQTKDKPVAITYKGAITQSTGEDWVNVPLTLETATPTFGLGVPTLTPWNLSLYRAPVYNKSHYSARYASGPPGMQPPMASMPQVPTSAVVVPWATSSDIMPKERPSIQHRELTVSSKGNISATFGVPGLISIPSDGVPHNVTIVKLALDATMSWVCVPKKDTKTHLKAKVKNASEYTLLSGKASVYVDGSFISKSDVPLVSPDESFDCPLGLDPSIRITYHPRSKKVSQSGFYTKTSNYVYSQRITVFNTKSSAIENLKIVDQAPVSEDSVITVKLSNPPLVLPGEGAGGTGTLSVGGGEVKVPLPVKVTAGVVAQWNGADEADVDVDALGRDGKLNWVCAVPAQGKIGLTLQWEVTAPVRTNIVGL
ncbi:hypothetical protein B0H34DRAFT_669000 [Crassisporium funariophilum]|nr:hypothetical protein B0H34DRAFT_669000 [Crassisporium funariophilum]